MHNFSWAKLNTLNQVHENLGVWISLEGLHVFQFGTAQPLIQTLNFSCAEPNAYIIITYFASKLTELSIFLPLNLVQLELRSVSESVQPV